MKLSDLMSDYIRHIASYRGFSPRTCECYSIANDQFITFLRNKSLTDSINNFTPETCEGFAKYLAAAGLKPNSTNVKLSALSSLAAYAMKVKGPRGRYLLDENPMTRFDRPRKERPRAKYLHRDELQKLIELDCQPHEKVILDCLIDTGCRSSELANADVGDAHIDSKDRVTISVSVKGRGRAKEKVPVAVTGTTAKRLIALLKQREAEPKEPLFVNSAGGRYTRSSLYELVARLGKRAGFDRFALGPHCLRRTLATLADEQGHSVAVIAGLLHHTDLNTVQKYIFARGARVNAALEQVVTGIRG